MVKKTDHIPIQNIYLNFAKTREFKSKDDLPGPAHAGESGDLEAIFSY